MSNFQTIRISSVETHPRQVNIEHGATNDDTFWKVELSAAAPGWLSAQWVVEPIEGTPFIFLRNVWQQGYLFATRFTQNIAILNLACIRFPGANPVTAKVTNVPEFQWKIYSNDGVNYFIQNSTSSGGQLHAETSNGVPTLVVNVHNGTDIGPIVDGTLMWNLEGYKP